jgi:hypothetical protein
MALVACSLVAVALAAVGCGGGPSPSSSGGGAADLVTYQGGGDGVEGVSFRYPASWRTYHYRCAPHFTTPIVYLSNQRLRRPCTRRRHDDGIVISGRAPVNRLGPGGVVVEWSASGSFGWTFEEVDGAPLRVDGFRAKLRAGQHSCRYMGADGGLVLTVERPDVPNNWYELRACIAGPDAASTEAEVRALIDSTKLPGAGR